MLNAVIWVEICFPLLPIQNYWGWFLQKWNCSPQAPFLSLCPQYQICSHQRKKLPMSTNLKAFFDQKTNSFGASRHVSCSDSYFLYDPCMWESKQAMVCFCVHGDLLVWRNVKRGSGALGTGGLFLVFLACFFLLIFPISPMSKHICDCCCPHHGQRKTAVCLERRLTMMPCPARGYFFKSLFSSLFSKLRGDQRGLCCIGCLRWNILRESCSHGAFNMLMSLSSTIKSSSHSCPIKQFQFSFFTHWLWKTM